MWRSLHGGRGQSASSDGKKIDKNQGKEGKIGKGKKNDEKNGKNQEGSFTLPLLTGRAGFATADKSSA